LRTVGNRAKGRWGVARLATWQSCDDVLHGLRALRGEGVGSAASRPFAARPVGPGSAGEAEHTDRKWGGVMSPARERARPVGVREQRASSAMR
jgi:hypothetical protein